MKHTHLILIVLAAALLAACASPQVKKETVERPPAAKVAPAKEAPAKEIGKKEAVPTEGEVADKTAPGEKFAKLKIGMTLKQVESLIGPPTRQWQRPTDKSRIPFYFGPDRWVIQYSYKGEGVLTLNYGEEQLLTNIEVNKAE